MYSDVGKKIMGLAKVCSWIIFISSIIICLCYIIDGWGWYIDPLAWIWLGIGVLSFIASWPLYGFGQLVDDVHAMRNQTTAPATQNDELPEL